jgi:hypothetical protein
MRSPYGRLHGRWKKHAAFAWPCLSNQRCKMDYWVHALNSLTPSPRKVFSSSVSLTRATLLSTRTLPKSTPPRARPKFVTFKGDRGTYCYDEEVRFDGSLDKATPIAATFLLLAVLQATMGRRCGGLLRWPPSV